MIITYSVLAILCCWLMVLSIKVFRQDNKQDTLSGILQEWDKLYADSDKQARRRMTINRQRYGIHTAAKMHGVING